VSESTWYNASQGVVEAANTAMREIASGSMDADERVVRITDVWLPVAEALVDSIPDEMSDEMAALAEALGPDFVGVTSDTRRVVSWGAAHRRWREFVIR
jgi:hypothetical protein